MSTAAEAVQRRLVAAAESVGSPVAIHVGLDACAALIDGLPRPIMVVTTERARRDPVARSLLSSVRDGDIWTRAHAHPGPDLIEETTSEIGDRAPATIIGLGGGSVLDLTKIAAAPHRESRPVTLVQIPTTAGTGADVTCWGTYWLPDGTKQSFEAAAGFADHALLVPELTSSMPPRLTLSTGLDAFVHAAEAIVGRRATPASTAVAREAIELVTSSIESAVVAPTDSDRAVLVEAATLAGLALSITRSAAAHALSYSLTGVHGLEHGLAVGLMWRGLAEQIGERSPDAMGVVLAALGVDRVAAAGARLDEWFGCAGLTPSMAALGLPAHAGRETIEQALSSNRLENQPGDWGVRELSAAIARIS